MRIAACLLVFLFAFHAKTAIYRDGLRGKPHTNTASKVWLKDKANPPRLTLNRFVEFITVSGTSDFSVPVFGRLSLQFQLASGFVPMHCFSGLSPPLTI